jgi:hypothetical protein
LVENLRVEGLNGCFDLFFIHGSVLCCLRGCC